MKKLTCIIFFVLSTYGVWAQHLILLEKLDAEYPQYFFEERSFPTAGIKTKYDEGYEITRVNYKNKRWFIAMIKKPTQSKQEYIHNPSSQVLTDRKNDGYSPVDYCVYYNGDNQVQTFYVLNKIATQAVNDTYLQYQVISNAIRYEDYPVFLTGMLSSATVNDFRIQSVRAAPHPRWPAQIIIGSVISKKQFADPWRGITIPEQIWTTRAEYPSDYIENQKQNGFKLKAITYSTYDKLWIVVMEKSSALWTLVTYGTRADVQSIIDKGGTIVGVF